MEINIDLPDDVSGEKYAHIANAVWCVLQASGVDFTIKPDDKADRAEMDRIWNEYGDEQWNKSGHGEHE